MVLFYKANGKKEIPIPRASQDREEGDSADTAPDHQSGYLQQGVNGSVPPRMGSQHITTPSGSTSTSKTPSISGI
jgi:hypothetical protein